MKELTTRTRVKYRPYSHALWVGAIGGAALVADAAPTNLASVPANRIIRHNPKKGALIGGLGLAAIRVIVANSTGANGTTMVWRLWFYDDYQSLWIPHGAVLTYTVATNYSLSATVSVVTPGILVGAKTFVQIVSNTALVDCFGVDEA